MQARTSLIETLVGVPLHSATFMPNTEAKNERGSCDGQWKEGQRSLNMHDLQIRQ